MIRVIHSFGVRTNPIGGSSPIAGNIPSLAGDGSSANPPPDMILTWKVLHWTSIQVPNQDGFDGNIINTQSSPLFKNANLHHKEIIIKAMPISAFLVNDVFNADLDAITIYRGINTLENLNKPAIQALLTFLRECITSRLVNYTGTVTPSSVFMEATPPSAHIWGLKKCNTTFPNIYTPRQDPAPASAPTAFLTDINLNIF